MIRVEMKVWPVSTGWPITVVREAEPVAGTPIQQQAAEVAAAVYSDVAEKLLFDMIQEG
jgi:hypothetical protein